MKLLTIIFFLSIFTSLYAGEYKIIGVTAKDGDTLKANIILGFDITIVNQSIRLSGIDTPETHTMNLLEKKAGLIVTQWLSNRISQGRLFLLITTKKERGKFGRILGILVIDGVNICNLLIEKGFAKVYNGGKKTPWSNKELNKIIKGASK